MKNITRSIVFDFDGTIAKSTLYHRTGWKMVLREIGLSGDLDDYLPYETNLRERFDSYRRIKSGFLKNKVTRERVKSYFEDQSEDDGYVKNIMDLKESFTITTILAEELELATGNLGVNLAPLIYDLRSSNLALGVVTSSRETIASSLLYKCGFLSSFDFIIGEESLTDKRGRLFDKPNKYAANKMQERGYKMVYYIGDNQVIDKEFAEACGAEYIYADYKTDFLKLLEKKIL